ncbi:MAG: Uncharacterised protein [Methanobacteriota archaeon]|nr:MAG: Uncharacterised protein [Euryarchaeota archaeon]
MREWPFICQFWPYISLDFYISCRQASIGIIISRCISSTVIYCIVLLSCIIPNNLFVSSTNIAYSVISDRIPLNLLPSSIGPKILNKGQRCPSGFIGTVSVISKSSKVRWVRAIAEFSTNNFECYRCILDWCIIETSGPIRCIMCLEVEPEWLLIATEISPSRVIYG